MFTKIRNIFNNTIIRTPHERDFMRCIKFLRINKVKGHYVEFGVGKGVTMELAYKTSINTGFQFINLIGYDSFKGMPKSKGSDKEFELQEGDYAFNIYNVHRRLKKRKVKRFYLKKSFYDKLTFLDIPRPISMLHIDCDYYQSSIQALNLCKNDLIVGSIIIFSDWYCFYGSDKKGERKAFYEFQKKNKHIKFNTLDSDDLTKIFYVEEIKK